MAASQPCDLPLAGRKVAIVGLGLMGGSLALALRGQCARLLGVDHDSATLERAAAMNLADVLSAKPAELLPQADVIILATPVGVIVSLLAELPRLQPGAAVVLDLGSTKASILAAMNELPQRFDPLGGHPMCGKERSSLAEAEPGLYQDAPFAFTPLERTSPAARRLAGELAHAVGAHPIWLDAHQHDRLTAATSHLPFLAANALAAITPLEAAALVGPGFRSTTRVAGSPTHIMLDILAANRANLLDGLAQLRGQLELLETALKNEDWDRLSQALGAGARRRQQLTEPLNEVLQ
ncbi:MAG: prephenate dehydrogenase/arogenate dehydrogenase family protein [Chloroflexota bacterium]